MYHHSTPPHLLPAAQPTQALGAAPSTTTAVPWALLGVSALAIFFIVKKSGEQKKLYASEQKRALREKVAGMDRYVQALNFIKKKGLADEYENWAESKLSGK